MTLTEQDLERLRQAARTATDDLVQMPSSIGPAGDVHHMVHDEYAERAVSMGRFLLMALDSAAAGQYAPAYALLRCALEHHLLDQLLLLADRYLTQGPTTEETFERWRQGRAGDEEGTESIVELTRNAGGHTRVVRAGPHVTNADGSPLYRLSAYYGYLDEFDPLSGPPGEQRYLEQSWTHLQQLNERAAEQQRLYGQAFTWKGIRDNLELNGFFRGEDLVRLNVHYRFLSGFVHLTPKSYRIPHQRPNAIIFAREEYREHVALELALTYVACLAARELELFLRVTGEQPVAHLADREDLAAHAEEARTVSAHLWFPGDPPHPYDRWRQQTEASWTREGAPTRQEVGVEEPYYRDPFERLADMHRPQSGAGRGYEPSFFGV